MLFQKMEEYIKKDTENLEILAAMRCENLVELTLDRFLESVECKKEVIDAVIDSSSNKRECERTLMELMSKQIEAIVEGKMTVIDYVEKNKSKQMVYVFLGTHWQAINIQLYYVFVKKCVRKMGLEDLYAEDTDFMNKVFERLAFRVMDYRKQKLPPGDVWVNFMNCTLEIHKDGRFEPREHRAEDFFTYVLPYAYSPNDDCPMWHKFLDRVLPEDEMQNLLAEYIGYCFTKNLKLEKMAVFYGTGSNGKSVLLDIVSKLLGSSNVSNVTLSALTNDDEKRALVEGKLANISHESKGDLDTAMLKQLVSGEPTEVRVLYRGTHTMTDIPKLFTSYNKLPSTESTYGFFRRWILFPFNVTIPDEEQDVELVNKLTTELSGILNWVLKALVNLVERKAFSRSEMCVQALGDYIKSSNSVLQFFSTRCSIDNEENTKLSDIYKAYHEFCVEEDLKRFGKKNFQEIIRNFGAVCKTKYHQSCYNIKIKSKDEDD